MKGIVEKFTFHLRLDYLIPGSVIILAPNIIARASIVIELPILKIWSILYNFKHNSLFSSEFTL